MPNGQMIDELRNMAQADAIPDAAFKRLIAAAMVELHERVGKLEGTWKAVIVSVLATALITIVSMFSK